MSEPWDRLPTFAVVQNGTLIGTVNFEVDPEKKSAMLGYAFGRIWWGQGLAIEAVRAAVTWAAQAFGLRRLWASTDTRNHRSRRLLENLGMQCEVIREGDHRGPEGDLVDEAVYGLEFLHPSFKRTQGEGMRPCDKADCWTTARSSVTQARAHGSR